MAGEDQKEWIFFFKVFIPSKRNNKNGNEGGEEGEGNKKSRSVILLCISDAVTVQRESFKRWVGTRSVSETGGSLSPSSTNLTQSLQLIHLNKPLRQLVPALN